MSAHFGSVSVFDATYLGRVFNATEIGLSPRFAPRSRFPRAGEDLVGPPAEQEGVGALVDLAYQGRGVSLSKCGMAHPPRSNPPHSPPPAAESPCITPSTETFMLTVSFMVMVPFSSGWSRRIGQPSRTSSFENTSVSQW